MENAGIFFMMPYVVSALLSPVLGWYVNKYGNRMTVTIAGSFVMLLSHIIQPFIPSFPECDKCWYSVIPLVLQGFSYTTYAVVLWGALPYMVEARAVGTAFGICTSAQNLATVVSPPLTGFIQ